MMESPSPPVQKMRDTGQPLKQIAILRHAKSAWTEPGKLDIDRTLNPRGHQQLLAVSTWFGQQEKRPDLVLCSPSVRTRETHAGLGDTVAGAELVIQNSLYEGSLDNYLSAIWACKQSDYLLVIGHNPACDELARYLAKPGGDAHADLMARHFGTAALAVFGFSGADWSGIGGQSCQLLHFLRPKQLEKAQGR